MSVEGPFENGHTRVPSAGNRPLESPRGQNLTGRRPSGWFRAFYLASIAFAF